MPLIISDSSTLIHLAGIGRLALLREFYGEITIPLAVWREVVVEGQGRVGAVEVDEAYRMGWIEKAAVPDMPLLRLLKRDLDDGEAEVIALAVERQADLVLLDESDGRRIADLYKLRKTGVVGLLMRAKREGRLQSLRLELQRLRQEGRFWIEEKLFQQALRAVGEE